MSKLQDVENAVVSGKSKLVAGLVQEALDYLHRIYRTA